MKNYKNIKTKENYDKLLNSGMFWEFHPELSGDWEKDKVLIGIFDNTSDEIKERVKVVTWWHSMTFEEKFYKTIAWLKSKHRNTTERHPYDLTNEEMQEVYRLHKNCTKKA